MLVDDHEIVRKGLSLFIRAFDDLELVGEADNGSTAVNLCREVLPDVVLMDIVMPELGGVAATSEIRKEFPQIQVIALTSFMEGDLVKNALKAGAIAYLLKDVSADELARTIRAAHTGRATLSPDAAQALVQSSRQPTVPDFDLTEREQEVLVLIVEGLNNSQIAKKLTVSPSTIKSHVSSILSKFGVTNRTEAVTIAFRNKLVS